MVADSSDNTIRTYARLMKPGPRGYRSRNLLRVWLQVAESKKEWPLVPMEVYKELGWDLHNNYGPLATLVERNVFHTSIKKGRKSYRLNPSIDAGLLLQLLGTEQEPPVADIQLNKMLCVRCNDSSPGEVLEDGVCSYCQGIEHRPWVARRVQLLAERAAQGLPLFGEEVPWQGYGD
jgi:hypothetical protein